MKFEDISTLLTPGELPYLSGVERLDNGIVHVAVLTRMPGVSLEMIRWWFGDYMRTTEHYKRWHPRDHVWMSWDYKQPEPTSARGTWCTSTSAAGFTSFVSPSFLQGSSSQTR